MKSCVARIDLIEPVLERITSEWVVALSPENNTPSSSSPVVMPVAAKKALSELTRLLVVTTSSRSRPWFLAYYYINYRLAAQRFTNLATRHLDIRSHFLRSDEQGVVWKAYGNSRGPFPMGPDGSLEGQLLCRQWGTRAAFHSEVKFGIHYQYTDTEVGTFWCSTHIEVDREPVQAITVGVRFEDARFFRGSDMDRHSVSRCPDGEC